MKSMMLPISIICVLMTSTASGQEKSNLAVPYGFRLPFLSGGEYLVSASSAYRWNDFTTEQLSFDSLNTSIQSVTYESDETSFDMNAILALTKRVLVSTTWSWQPTRKAALFSDGGSALAGDVTLVFRPADRFEIFTYYRQEKDEYKNVGKTNVADRSIRAGLTWFGKF